MTTVDVLNELFKYVRLVKENDLIDDNNFTLVEATFALLNSSGQKKTTHSSNESRKSKVFYVGKNCKHCGRKMQRRRHPVGWKPKAGKKTFFSQWDYCKKCKHVQHYEEFKVQVVSDVVKPLKAIVPCPNNSVPWDE